MNPSFLLEIGFQKPNLCIGSLPKFDVRHGNNLSYSERQDEKACRLLQCSIKKNSYDF